ncbi:MAG: hypothetical protein QG671_569 [Actinomycetota bacterium]|nr:hypothetical protein [Actinomycetota bacterium]
MLRDRVLEPFGIVIEFDGRLGHSDPTGRLRDNRRDNFVALTGRVPLRYGWQDVHERACECADEIATVLALRGWRGTPEVCGAGCRLGP